MTATEIKAEQAWRLMTREPSVLDSLTGGGPMPIWAAIDFVQDEAGDRDEARRELILSGARWLSDRVPAVSVGHDQERWRLAQAACGRLMEAAKEVRHARFAMKRDRARREVVSLCYQVNYPDPRGEGLANLDRWRVWLRELERVIDFANTIRHVP